MTNCFNSKYPIVALAMNQVSNAKFAVDCHNVGIYPSISLFNYRTLKEFILDVSYFKDNTGTTDFLFSLNFGDFRYKQVLNIIDKLNIKSIELVVDWPISNDILSGIRNEIEKKQSKDIKFYLKCNDISHLNTGYYNIFDGFILKGNNSAGILGKNSIDLMFSYAKNKCPEKFIIPSGGIGNKEYFYRFINHGAASVGIGTLFALSEESPIPKESKLAMINKKRSIMINSINHKKGAIVFSKMKNENNDHNNTESLISGITSGGKKGHIYAGTAIENIKEIKPLKQIVEELI